MTNLGFGEMMKRYFRAALAVPLVLALGLSSCSREPATQLRPQTINLQQRAELAINAMTQSLDPKLDYQPYFFVTYGDPPKMQHNFWDFGDASGRFVDALALARLMTGNRKNLERDAKLREFTLSLIGEDGLTWVPAGTDPDTGVRRPGAKNPAVAEMFSQRSNMMGLLGWYLAENDPTPKQYIDRMIAGLWKIAVKEKDYCYYPDRKYFPTGWKKKGPPEPGTAAWNGVQIYPLVRYWEATGSPEALKLAKGLINYMVYHSKDFGPDGSFGTSLASDGSIRGGHFHGHTHTMAGILRFAIRTNDQELIDWVWRAYRSALGLVSSFGWAPWFSPPIPAFGRVSSEACGISDMIDLAIQFGRLGKTEEWETAERFVRNQFLEQQLTKAAWLESQTRKEDTPDASYQNVAARSIGSFGGWCTPNDFVHLYPESGYPDWVIMHCCTGHGTRGLYQAWHNIVTEKPEGVYVNLWFSRDTPAVEVDSFLPYEGKLEVRVHQAPTVYVRVPEGVDPDEVRGMVNNREKSPQRAGAYMGFSGLRGGDVLTVSVPLKKRTTKETVAGVEYTLEWKGNTIVGMSPKGTLAPLYQREDYLADRAPLGEVDYYVPAQEVAW